MRATLHNLRHEGGRYVADAEIDGEPGLQLASWRGNSFGGPGTGWDLADGRTVDAWRYGNAGPVERAFGERYAVGEITTRPPAAEPRDVVRFVAKVTGGHACERRVRQLLGFDPEIHSGMAGRGKFCCRITAEELARLKAAGIRISRDKRFA